MPGRLYNSANYRYGFNGKENDNEVKGVGNSLDFEARIYDTRIGRWLSIDPLVKKYPEFSPYIFSNNKPIWFTDPDGLDPRVAIIIEQHPEKNEFNDHIKGLEAAGYTIIKVKTGEEFLNTLKAKSSKDSPIEDLVIISHAANDGFFGLGGKDNGFYTPSGFDATAEATKSMEYISSPAASSDMVKAMEYVGSDEFKKNVVDPYKNEMIKNGARTTEDLKKMINQGEINLSDKSKEIVLGGCNTVSREGNKTIATEIANVTRKVVVGSSSSTEPVHHSTQRKGVWNKVSPYRTVIPINQGNKLDLPTREVKP